MPQAKSPLTLELFMFSTCHFKFATFIVKASHLIAGQIKLDVSSCIHALLVVLRISQTTCILLWAYSRHEGKTK